MSGLAGLLKLTDEPVSQNALDDALEHLACYGPDGSGIWSGRQVVLAHRLLRITPYSFHENQPYTEHNLTVVADARIDNRAELYRIFQIPSAEQNVFPDSRLILLAYQKWGDACASYLIGDFAFAVWDAPKQRLFCARDHIGTRPFFYFYDARIFAFSSDILALLAIEGVADEIDETEIGSYLFSNGLSYHENHYTFRKNIFRLPFAHQLAVNRDDLRLRQYWYPENSPSLRLSSDAAYAKQLRELIELAVNDRLVSKFPVGVHLSGGIDSSSIAIIASRVLRDQGRNLTAYSWSPQPADDATDKDEYRRILAVRSQEDMELVFIGKLTDDLNDNDISLRPRNTLFAERLVQEDATQRGIRTILSGWGGDETSSFFGGGLPARLFLTGRWLSLLKNLKRPNQRIASRSALKAVVRGFWRHVIFQSLPLPVQNRFPVRTHHRPPGDRWMRPAFATRIASQVRPRPPFNVARLGSHQTQFGFFYHGHMTSRLEAWAWAGAEYQIQYVFPLLDRRVMEFAYGVPDELYWKNGWMRYLFRLATDDLFPEGMAWNALGGLKSEPAFHSLFSTDNLASRMPELMSLVNRNPDVPWIDIERLQADLPEMADLPPVDRWAVWRALDCVRIWENWKTASYKNTSHDDSG